MSCDEIRKDRFEAVSEAFKVGQIAYEKLGATNALREVMTLRKDNEQKVSSDWIAHDQSHTCPVGKSEWVRVLFLDEIGDNCGLAGRYKWSKVTYYKVVNNELL